MISYHFRANIVKNKVHLSIITKWWFIAVGAWVSKNHTKVPAKNVKENIADREDVILKASLKNWKK